jgi:transcriptional regulator with XRE-family HTH domain
MRRMVLGMSQARLAQALDVTFQQVQKYEKALNGISADRLYDLCKVLRVTVSFFYEGLAETDRAAGGLSEPSTPAFVYDVLGSREGAALIEAFARIQSGHEKRVVVSVAAAFADRSTQ